MREKSGSRDTYVEGDFNNDGKTDTAYLLKSTRHNGQGLLVRLSIGKGTKWHVVDEIKWDEKYKSVGLSMGIRLAQPGKYKTACGKGYWDCNPEEPEVLELKNPGIWYFRYGSASSIVYWNGKSKSFIRVWISD